MTVLEHTETKSVSESLPKISLSSCDPEKIAEQEKRERHKQMLALFEMSGIPDRYKKKPDVGGKWGDAYSRMVEKIDEEFLVIIFGSRGTGKSHMACEIGKEFMRQLKPARYTKSLEMFVVLRHGYNSSAQEFFAAADTFLRPSILIVDSCEERTEKEFDDRMLNYVIDKRYDKMKNTILITNETKESFVKSANPSIVSRVQETGFSIVCDWPSFRKC